MNTALQLATQTAVTAQTSWGERITAAWQKQVQAIFATGHLLVAAKDELGRGNWMRMAKNQLPFGVSTANKLMKIGACDHFRDSELIPNLPANWAVLFELSLLDIDQFELSKEKFHPKMKLKDAKALRGIGSPEPDAEKKSPMSILKNQLEEQNHTIAHLQEQLASAEAGSQFDLKKDSVKNIVNVIVNEVHMGVITRNKALELADGIKAALTKKKGS